jgi:hypothetical protein
MPSSNPAHEAFMATTILRSQRSCRCVVALPSVKLKNSCSGQPNSVTSCWPVKPWRSSRDQTGAALGKLVQGKIGWRSSLWAGYQSETAVPDSAFMLNRQVLKCSAWRPTGAAQPAVTWGISSHALQCGVTGALAGIRQYQQISLEKHGPSRGSAMNSVCFAPALAAADSQLSLKHGGQSL